MKTTLVSLIAVIAFGTCLAGQSQAQTNMTKMYRANIPFDFVIGKKHFHAGDYLVEERGFESKLFVIREPSGHNPYMMVASTTEEGSNVRGAQLEFQMYNGTYLLRVIRTPGLAADAPTPKFDRSLAIERSSKTVAVSLLRKN